jgi:predicted 3-demethylubiquinone-9 3-methyltransferase (glyoxalase superfamily)
MDKITVNLGFNGNAEEAANFYVDPLSAPDRIAAERTTQGMCRW